MAHLPIIIRRAVPAGDRPALGQAEAEALAISAFGEPNRRLSRCGELRFGRRGSVSFDPARGVWFDHEAGHGGGFLALRLDARATRRESAAERREREALAEAEDRRKRALAAHLWASAEPLSGSLGERYLREARAIAAPLDRADLRFLAEAPLRPLAPVCRDTTPAIVARISTAADTGFGVHLTYLRPDGLAKAEVPIPRKIVGRAGGAMVRLAPGARLVVAEGIESALSAWDALADPAAGCIAAISAGGMARLAWPVEARELVIAPDRDPSGTGERAALALAERAYGAGLAASIYRPPEGCGDWNDAARAGRVAP